MTQPERIAVLLGGEKALNAPVHSFRDWDRLIREGLPTRAVKSLVEALQLQRSLLLSALGIPKSTWSRRLQQRRFAPDESDRLYRLAYVVARAEDILGTREKALAWLVKPNRALEMESPLSRLETEAGYETVRNLLGRIEYGVYS